MKRMELEQFLERCIGKEVISSTSGGEAGFIWLIEFKDNSYFLIYCAWRLEQNEHVIATSTDNATADTGLLSRSVRLLEGKRLLSYELSEQYDLILYFDNNYCVRTFCFVSYSQTENGGAYDTNWEFGIPESDKIVCINNHFQVVEEKYYIGG